MEVNRKFVEKFLHLIAAQDIFLRDKIVIIKRT